VAVFLCWTPTGFVEKHEEDVSFLPLINLIQWFVQEGELQKALRHEVVLDTLVLKVSVHSLYKLQVGQGEAHELVRRLVLI